MSAPSLPTSKAPNNWLATSTAGATLTGVAGKANQLSAQAGKITLVGAANGDNTFIVYDPSDKIVQAASPDVNTVETWGSGYALPANVQNLTLEGTASAYAIGNAGDNLIIGNAGADTITTDGGNDVLVAGTGVDTFNVTPAAGTTTWIEGFKSSGATLDQLNLSPYFHNLASVKAAATQIGSDLQIALGNGQTVMLQNTQASALTASDVQTGVDLSTMHLTFDEEFNSISLSSTSATLTTSQNVWNTTYSGGVRSLSANAEQELYVDPSYKKLGLNPFSDSNGVLTIQASPTPSADASAIGLPYISGVLTTQGTFSQEYGYFDAGIETPAGQGLWPAFWLLPTSGAWPPELDVMEQVDDTSGGDTTSYSTVHSKVVANQSAVVVMPQDLTGGFHDYGMDWTASTITFYIDGQQIAQMPTPADANQPMYLLLDFAVGGTWPGSPSASTDWSTAQMKVDYVRAYAANPVTSAVRPAADFLGASTSDFLMENSAGAVVAGAVSGGQLVYTQIGAMGPEWQTVGSDDFLGTGVADLLYHSTASGALVVGAPNGASLAFTAIGGVGAEWQFDGSGDLLGDGKTGFLMHDSANGALVVGEVANGAVAYIQISQIGNEWLAEGVGSYGGGSQDSFLLQNQNSGALVLGMVANGSASYSQIGAVGPEWQFVGTGDFLGSGHDDFLMRNTQTGALVVGDASSGQAAYTQIGGAGPEWSFVGSGDYTGSGTAGFMMESTTGALVLGTVANGQASYAQVGAVGSEWTAKSMLA